MSEPAVHEDVHALSGAYVLDALDDDERGAYERHLSSCTDCADQVPGMRAAAARLGATSYVTPPAQFRESVLEAVGRTRQLPPVPSVTSLEEVRRRRFGTRLLAAAAALLLVIAGGLAVAVGVEHQSASEKGGSLTAIEKLLTDPEQTRRLEVPGGGTAVLRTVGQSALVTLTGAAAPPAGKTFELWSVSPSGPQKEGLWHSGDEQTYLRDVSSASALAVTLEPAGGSEQPTSEPFITFPV